MILPFPGIVSFSPAWTAVVHAIFLGVPVLVLFLRGRRYGRRGSSSVVGIAVRAGLGTLALSWTISYGIPELSMVFPALLMLISQVAMWITRDPWLGRDLFIPLPWLSVACALCAYVVGALRGRATRQPQIGDT